jgi:ATP-dependent RNA helicase DeaD
MASDEAGSITTFPALGLDEELVSSLVELGYEEPTPIQREAIPRLLEGRDLLGQAATGTGKTGAFSLPMLQVIARDRGASAPPAGLVLVPTRELAIQVSEAIHRYGSRLGTRVLPLYGGQPIGRQLRSLERGVDVVVATPGRALDHITRTSLRLDELRVVVLDEADEMLDMGFVEDIETILASAPEVHQTVMFSATMPARIDALARRHLRDPLRIELGRQPSTGSPALVRQTAYLVPRAHKAAALGRVLDIESPNASVVFCRTRDEVDTLTATLNGRGYRAEALHGGMDQEQRDRVMGRLRSGATELLVATDVAARGLDIEQLELVVNFDVPSSPDTYVHRTGRVGRAGREGVAITLAEPREHRLLKSIERATNQRIPVEKLPTVADLRARRLELTRAALREALLDDDFEQFRVVVESLADEFDVMDVALAAIKLAHEADGPDDEAEIPEVTAPRDGERRTARRTSEGGGPRPARNGKTTRLFVGAGRAAGVRPGDLVGAIAGESSLRGRDIGSIEIADRFSLVEIPESAADEVIAALRSTTIKGRRPQVRRERFDAR